MFFHQYDLRITFQNLANIIVFDGFPFNLSGLSLTKKGNDINDYTNCHSEPSALSGAEGAAKNLYCKDASLRSA